MFFSASELQVEAPAFFEVPPFEGFEGPEKRLDIGFRRLHTFPHTNHTNANPRKPNHKTLLSITRDTWQEILNTVQCTIISKVITDHANAFVLSESSLFVYADRIMIKTCGTTTLLNCVSGIIDLASKECHMEIETLFYSHKNFNFPHKQPHPHTRWEDETAVLNQFFEGKHYVFGSPDKDHWSLYVYDDRRNSKRPTSKSLAPFSQSHTTKSPNTTLEIMMHNLDPVIMSQFYKRDGVTVQDTTKMSGISDFLPGSIIDAFQFEPCGYSMNGLWRGEGFEQLRIESETTGKKWYWTMHITPEDHCSYVSFETNAPLEHYTPLLNKVVKAFNPEKFSSVLITNEPCIKEEDPRDINSLFGDGELDGYFMQDVFENKCIGHQVLVCNYAKKVEKDKGER